jgi:hypothetical protein
MEYTKLITLKNDLLIRDKPNSQNFMNPIERYNYFIERYNMTSEERMILTPCGSFYSVGNLIQNGFLNYIIIFVIIPLLIYFSRVMISFEDLFFIIFTFYFFLVFSASLITLIIYLNAKFTYKKNLKRISNPFKKMIFHPDLCRIMNVNNLQIEYNADNLDNLNLTDAQISVVKTNPITDNKVKFMIYDQGFIDFYSEVGQYNIYLVKHVLWLFSSIVFYLIFIFINDESD